MQNQMNVMPGQGSKKLDTSGLKALEDQLNYESLISKKFSNYANLCTDTQLKDICIQSSKKHKQHFNELLNYLNFHQ